MWGQNVDFGTKVKQQCNASKVNAAFSEDLDSVQ